MDNNIVSTSSKNQKAKELGVPIITEREFIIKFGDPEEYKIEVGESDFWCTFTKWLESEEDFEDTIKTLYAYSQWISKSTLDRAIRSIIDIADLVDEEIQDDLVELVSKLETGEEVEDEEDGN